MATHEISTQEAVATWKIAHRFVLDVYRLTNKLPREEHYGLIPKIRTSSVKIASNIVEGYARKSGESYMGHLSESQVALEETKYSLLVARDLGYISEHTYDRTMADAEAISERLESLQGQLSAGLAPAVPQTQNTSGAFAVNKGVRHTLADSWSGLKARIAQVRDRRKPVEIPDNVWVEESRVHSYLDGPK